MKNRYACESSLRLRVFECSVGRFIDGVVHAKMCNARWLICLEWNFMGLL